MPTKRIRGRKLQKIRRLHFADSPLCVRCEAKGKVREAVQLDHRNPLHKGGLEDEDNRQGLCVECHAEKTREDMGYRKRPVIGADGYPVEGSG